MYFQLRTPTIAALVVALSASPLLADIDPRVVQLVEREDGTLLFLHRNGLLVGWASPTPREQRVQAVYSPPPQLPGWPAVVPEVESTPTVGDVDADGLLEVVFASVSTAVQRVYVVRADGSFQAGWPPDLEVRTGSSPTLADIDGNRTLEIFIPGRTTLYVLTHEGQIIPGWDAPQTNLFRTVAVGDLEGDGELDVSAGHPGNAYLWDSSGTLKPGWPVQFPSRFDDPTRAPALGDTDGDGVGDVVLALFALPSLYSFERDGTVKQGFPITFPSGVIGASLADLNGDGAYEIIFQEETGGWVLDGTGQPIPGWPVAPAPGNAAPAVGDLDGDGRLEIVWGTPGGDGRVFAYDDDGSPVPGWPVTALETTFNAQPTLGDIDGDGGIDVVLGGLTTGAGTFGRIYAWHADGTPVAGFPFQLPDNKSIISSSVTITDLDQDGDAELLVGTLTGIGGGNDGRVFAFDLDAPYDPSTMEWPTLGHDIRHTSRYEPPPPSPGFVDDTDRLDEVLGPDPFPVIDTVDITEAATRFDICDFSCSGGPEVCCGNGAVAAGEPALIFTMSLIGAGSEPQLVDAEYEVDIDFGEEGLRDFTGEPGLITKDPKKGTADVRLKLDLKEKKKKKKGSEKGAKSPFKGLKGLERLSQVDQTAGTIDFVVPVSELQAKANEEQAAASGFDQYHQGSVDLLLWFRTKKKIGEGAEAGIELNDRAPNTNDNLAPTIASEALEFTIPFRCAHGLCEEGVALDRTCHWCVGAICAADPFCCDVEWGWLCVEEAATVCELDCP